MNSAKGVSKILMSLKTVTIGNSLADIKNREGVEGLLIGINVANKAFVTYCFPLKDPWTLTSMNLLATGQSINESEMKKCLSLIKKTKYLLYGGVDFLGFYVNCNTKDQKTYELKLINPICNRLQQNLASELINIYNVLDANKTMIYHLKGQNNEKISEKAYSFSDSFFEFSTYLEIEVVRNNNFEDFLNNIKESLEGKAKQLENSSLITLDNIYIMNEQESFDYYFRNKNDNKPIFFDFHVEKPETELKAIKEGLLMNIKLNLKAIIHKKSPVIDGKKIFIDEIRAFLKKRLKFLPQNENISLEDILEEGIKEIKLFPVPARDNILLKKKHEFYNYRNFYDKSPFDFYLSNFCFSEKDIEVLSEEKTNSIIDFTTVYRNKFDNELGLFQKKSLEKSQKIEESQFLESNKKSKDSMEKITARTEKTSISEKTDKIKEIPVSQALNDSSDNQKYILMAVIIVLLIIIRIIMNNWF